MNIVISIFKRTLFWKIYLQNNSFQPSFRQEVNRFIFGVKNISELYIRIDQT